MLTLFQKSRNMISRICSALLSFSLYLRPYNIGPPNGVCLFVRLVKLLEDIMDGSRILIFMDTKKGCDQITRQLRMDGWPALSIHGDKSQAERDWVLSEFKSGKSPIMTATDVAARGLGTKTFALLCLINYMADVLIVMQISLLLIYFGDNNIKLLFSYLPTILYIKFFFT